MKEIFQQKLLHLISHKSYSVPQNYDEKYFQHGFADIEKFFRRFGNLIDSNEVKNSTIIDIGSGYGTTCIFLALRGAKHVTGVEIRQSLVEFADKKIDLEYPHLKKRVRFINIEDLGDEKFDIAISKDSFEHYENPSYMLKTIYGLLKDDGKIFLAFSPLWKSPFGGHMNYVTSFPWAHLIFPENVMLAERKRLTGENITKYSDISGGLNQMTLEKFRRILAESDFSPIFLKTNVSTNRVVNLFNILKHIPFCEEYFTVNLYTILQKRGLTNS
jgi:SAM-dependent methyltransferase